MLMLDGKVEVKKSVFPRSFLALPERDTYQIFAFSSHNDSKNPQVSAV